MKKILLTVITLFVVISGHAQYQLPTEEGFFNLNQSEYNKWGGCWYEFGDEGDDSYWNFDASAYDYVWIKFSGNTGQFRFGINYNEWKSTTDWGEQPWDEITYISEREGYAFIKLEKTKTYEYIGPNKKISPFAGDTWDKHIREVFTQDDGTPVQVTVEGVWFGTQAQFDELPMVYNYGGFKFTKTGATTCVVSGFSSSGMAYVKIPSTYNGLTVTGISEEALKGVGDYNSLCNVVIPDGITSIGERAFAMQTNLTSVTLPEGLTVIETGLFEGCSSLSQFNIPSTVELIKPLAFNALPSNFQYLIIPESVQTICSQAFCIDPNTASQVKVICESPTPPAVDVKTKDRASDQWYEGSSFKVDGGGKLGQLIVPVGSKAAYEASDWKNSFSEIVEESIVNSVSVDGFYFNLNTMGKAEVISNPSLYSGEIVIPESIMYNGMSYKVTSIGENAFTGCSSLTSVHIPSSVNSIGNNAFEGCNNLVSVIVKPLVPIDISDNVFPNRDNITLCVYYASSVDAYSSTAPWSGFKRIIAIEYTDNQGLIYTLNEDGSTYSVSGYTDACTGTISIPETVNGYSVTSIRSWAFSGIGGMSSVTIPKSVISIEGNPFGPFVLGFGPIGRKPIIIVAEGNPVYYSRDYCLIETATDKLIYGYNSIPNGVRAIGDDAFRQDFGLSNIIIPDGVTSIGASAFFYCPNLGSIIIPSSVTSIDKYAFSDCERLSNVFCYAKDAPTTVAEIFDYDTNISNATLYVSEGSVAAYQAVAPWSEFGRITVATSDAQGLIYTLNEDGSTYSVSGYTEKCTGAITIPETVNGGRVTTIDNYTFCDCSGLTSITIPNSVTSIGNSAFHHCNGLTSITIPNSVTSIGNSAFFLCSGLTSITIPNSVTSIGALAFYGCYVLTNVYCHAENVPTTGIFDIFQWGSPGYATLHVPASSIEDYRASASWSGFSEIVALPDQTVSDLFKGSYLWASYVADKDLAVPTGLTAYVITDMDNSSAIASQIAYIPQGVPVLLKRDDATINSYTFTSGTGTPPTTNLLKAYTEDKTVANREGYVLYKDEFVLVNAGTLPAGRVFLPLSGGNAAMTRGIVIEGDGTTGIQNLVSDSEVSLGEWYDLQGRKLDGKPIKKGVYILNGRKVVVK